MDNEKLIKLFYSIKNDDINLFNSLISSGDDLKISFGRFPILSLCYLYESYSIINKYENYLYKLNDYMVVSEFNEIYLTFKHIAGKSLRLYTGGQIISPLEMLAILDNREKIAKNYENIRKNDEIINKVEKIYSIKNETKIKIDKDNFTAPRKRYNFETKLTAVIVLTVLILLTILPVINIFVFSSKFGLGIAESPTQVSSKNEFVLAVNKNKSGIVLYHDILLEEDDLFDSFTGNIDGNGNTIYLSTNVLKPIFENFSGTLKNIKISINNDNLMVTEDLAIIAKNLYGTIDNCIITGTLNITFDSEDDTYFALYSNNIFENGVIENSSAEVTITSKNNTGKNAFLTNFSSKNQGKIINCTSSLNSSLSGETVDISCFASENQGTISSCTNNSNLTQTSKDLWHPNVAGFVIDNYGTIESCVNNGKVSSTSELAEVEDTSNNFVVQASGIAVNNNGIINNCNNTSVVTANGIISTTYSCGISIVNCKEISNCTNSGQITSYSEKNDIYLAGITASNTFASEEVPDVYNRRYITSTGSVTNCVNSAILTFNQTEEIESGYSKVYVGGIAAYNDCPISNCSNSEQIQGIGVSAQTYIGGIVGYQNNNISTYLDATITSCHFDSNITVTSYESCIGGIVGYSSAGVINLCYVKNNINNVNCNNCYVGGVVGYSIQGDIRNCYVQTRTINNFEIVTDDENSGINDENTDLENSENIEQGEEEQTEETETHVFLIGNISGYYEYNYQLYFQFGDIYNCTNCAYVSSDNEIITWYINRYHHSEVQKLTEFSGATSYSDFESMQIAFSN